MDKKVVAVNRKAYYDYAVFESWDAGIVLKGCEVKSIRDGKINLRDSFGKVEQGEIFVYNIHISEYDKSHDKKYDPVRKRKLLLKRREINKIEAKVKEKGLTIVPLEMHFARSYAKLKIALAKGKKKYDKREAIQKKDVQRELDKLKKRIL